MGGPYYRLDGHAVVPCPDTISWGQWFETAELRVAHTKPVAGVLVSTCFLGLDHAFGQTPPQLFETVVFGGSLDGEMDRYATWEEAEKGHAKVVARVLAVAARESGGTA